MKRIVLGLLFWTAVLWIVSCEDMGGHTGSRNPYWVPDSTAAVDTTGGTGCDTVVVEVPGAVDTLWVPSEPETMWVYVSPDTIIVIDDDLLECVRDVLDNAPPHGMPLWEAIYACLPAQ